MQYLTSVDHYKGLQDVLAAHEGNVARLRASQACWMRKKYVPLYIKALQAQHMGGDEETRRMDEALPEPTILLFRRLAHAQVSTSLSFLE